MRCSLIVLVGWVALSGPLSAQSPAPTIVMEDQFEVNHDVKLLRGQVVVLIYGDRASAASNRTLGEQLHITFHPTAKGQTPAKARLAPVLPIAGAAPGSASPDVLAIPVACIGKVPMLVRRLIRAQMKSGSPEVPVWLDFEDTMKLQFGFKAGVPNLVVIDTQGRYRFGSVGVPSQEGLQKIVQTIEALRREAITSFQKK